jgi:hypothetical protein
MIEMISFLKVAKKLKAQPTAGKIMTSVFWNSERINHVDFLPHSVTINAQHYSNMFCNVYKVIQKKRPWETARDDHPAA